MGKDAEIIVYIDENIEIHKDELERDFPRLVILNKKHYEKTGFISGELSLFDLITLDDFYEHFLDWIEEKELTDNEKDKILVLFDEYLKELEKQTREIRLKDESK